MAKKKTTKKKTLTKSMIIHGKNGDRKITMKKVKPHGPNGNLKWKITKNRPVVNK